MDSERRFVIALGCLASLAIFQDTAWSWERRFVDPVSDDFALAVALDANGDVVAAGQSDPNGTFEVSDFVVAKLRGSDGQELWRTDIDGTDDNDPDPDDDRDVAEAVAVDPLGDVFAAGRTQNAASFNDFTVVKLDGVLGSVLWQRDFSGTDPDTTRDEKALAVATTPFGVVVVAGSLSNVGTQEDFTVIGLASSTAGNGLELWRVSINGSANGRDQATAVAVDMNSPTFDVVAVGFTAESGTSNDIRVVKIRGNSGEVLWSIPINGAANGDDFGWSVAVDSAGDVVVAGQIEETLGDPDFFVVKLRGSDGQQFWTQPYRLDGTATGPAGLNFDVAYSVTIDSRDDDVVAAGTTSNTATGYDFTVVKIRSFDRFEIWRRKLDGGTNSTDEARTVTVNQWDDVFAGGSLRNATDDFAVVKLNHLSGLPVWSTPIDGTQGTYDGANAVVADPTSGDVIAAGWTVNTGTETDFTVVKLRSSDGTEFPYCGNDRLDRTSEQCDDGNFIDEDSCSVTCQEQAGPESFSLECVSGCVATTDQEGDGATPDDPVETQVFYPPNPGGFVVINEGDLPVAGTEFRLFGQLVKIEVDPIDPGQFIRIWILVDRSRIPVNQNLDEVQVFRDGSPVARCVVSGVLGPDPCVSDPWWVGDDLVIEILTTSASEWTVGAPEAFSVPALSVPALTTLAAFILLVGLWTVRVSGAWPLGKSA